MESTTTAISRAEDSARTAFKSFDALSASLRAQLDPPNTERHSTIGALLLAATKHDSATIKGRHAEIESQFKHALAEAIGILEEQERAGTALEKAAKYLTNESATCPDEYQQYAELVKAASSTGVVNAAQVAADMLRSTRSAMAELKRVRSTWAEKTKSAALVALRGKRFLLSHEAGFDDANILQHKLHAAQKLYDNRYGISTKRRTIVGSAR